MSKKKKKYAHPKLTKENIVTNDETQDSLKSNIRRNNDINTFLYKYGRLERLFRESDIDIKDASMLGMFSTQQCIDLDTCRKIRNYYVHNCDLNQSTYIFLPTQASFDLLDELYDITSDGSRSVKKSRLAISANTTVRDAISILKGDDSCAIVYAGDINIGIVKREKLVDDMCNSAQSISVESIVKHLIPIHAVPQINVTSQYTADEVVEAAKAQCFSSPDCVDVIVNVIDDNDIVVSSVIYSF